MKTSIVFSGLALLVAVYFGIHAQPSRGISPDTANGGPTGARIYQERCASCHQTNSETGLTRAPLHEVLITFPRPVIIKALTTGTMKPMVAGLSIAEVEAVADYLVSQREGDRRVAGVLTEDVENRCPAGRVKPTRLGRSDWNGWSPAVDSARYQAKPGLSAAQVPRLKVKWVYRISGPRIYSPPSIVGDRAFVGSWDGDVVALDLKTGCTIWQFKALSGVRSGIVVGQASQTNRRLFVFAMDDRTNVYALDADNGELVWRVQADDHPATRGTGSFRLYDGVVYAPASSLESVSAANPNYPCCTFRGSITALDARDGRRLWKNYTIPEQAAPYRVSTAGIQNYGPAGAAIWTSLTVDPVRRRVYGGTSNSYTEVSTGSSNAIVAMNLADGSRAWINQYLKNDNFIAANCRGENAGKNNCPKVSGPDLDFASAPILRTLGNGHRVLLAAQKSGMLYAMDPDAGGKRLWEIKVAGSGSFGGIQYGFAADNQNAYLAVSNLNVPAPDKPGGVVAVNIHDGKIVWRAPPPPRECSWGSKRCSAAQDSVPAVIPGVVFAGSANGKEYAYSTKDGRVIWQFDTGREFDAVNGGKATGGSLENGVHAIANGTLLITSGYTGFNQTGNALIALSVDGK